MDIIDLENGTVHISDTIQVSQNSSFSELRALYPDNKTCEVGNGYCWIYFQNKIEGKTFFFNICFYEDTLFQVQMSFLDLGEKQISWEEWSEEYERKNQQKYEKWLTQKLGRQRDFPWGRVTAFLDLKSCISGILVNYIKWKIK